MTDRDHPSPHGAIGDAERAEPSQPDAADRAACRRPEPPAGEHGQLLDAAAVFRGITDHTVMRRQLEIADRLASLGATTAGVSHEISNPLAIVMANVGYVRGEIDDIAATMRELLGPDAGELAARLEELSAIQTEIAAASTRISKIITDLKAFARPATPRSQEADVGRAIGWATRTMAHELRNRARVTQDVPVLPPAAVHEARLGQVIVNLLRNAAQAIAPGRFHHNEVAIRARAEQGRIVIEVRDTGPGIPSGDRQRIFEPFFTTSADEATGLGLAVCQAIVTSIGGEIAVESEPGAGTTFRVVVPAAVRTAPEPVSEPAARGKTRRGRILVVDDDVMIHRTVKRLLRDHELVCTESARDALALLARGETFDLILSDLMMPNMTGIEFYNELVAHYPALARRVVFVTGGALATVKVEGFLRSAPNVTLEKPFGVPEMQALVARMLDDDR